MLKAVTTKRFEKELKNMIRTGKNPEKFKEAARKLVNMESLDARYREHKLAGNFKCRLECHLEPD